jgi:hypothetical protein
VSGLKKLFQILMVVCVVGGAAGFQLAAPGQAEGPKGVTNGAIYRIYLPLVTKGSTSKASVGEVVINEFVAANGTIFLTEWVELYNKSGQTLEIGGMWIDDVAGGGGNPVQIPAETKIEAKGFYVMTFSAFLNNGGDEVRLLGENGVTIFDAKTYTTAAPDKSWCRKPDGESWAALECDPTFGSSNNVQTSEPWTPGNLEIRVLNVGQGDAQLIIGPTGKTLLIDVAELNWSSNKGAMLVASEIRRIMGSGHVDYVMATHWHLDHIGYAGEGGIWSLLEEQGITADKLIDRDAGAWVDADHDGVCEAETEIEWHHAGTLSGTAEHWACWATNPASKGSRFGNWRNWDRAHKLIWGWRRG